MACPRAHVWNLITIAYAASFGIMDVGQAKTRFLNCYSDKADELTLHPHREREFWLWVASRSCFLQRPSQLGFSDRGFYLPVMDVRWHEVPVGHAGATLKTSGQHMMFRDAVKELSKLRAKSGTSYRPASPS